MQAHKRRTHKKFTCVNYARAVWSRDGSTHAALLAETAFARGDMRLHRARTLLMEARAFRLYGIGDAALLGLDN